MRGRSFGRCWDEGGFKYTERSDERRWADRPQLEGGPSYQSVAGEERCKKRVSGRPCGGPTRPSRCLPDSSLTAAATAGNRNMALAMGEPNLGPRPRGNQRRPGHSEHPSSTYEASSHYLTRLFSGALLDKSGFAGILPLRQQIAGQTLFSPVSTRLLRSYCLGRCYFLVC